MYNLYICYVFYPGFRCQLSPTASFVCKNKTQSELQPVKKMQNAVKAPIGANKIGRYVYTISGDVIIIKNNKNLLTR